MVLVVGAVQVNSVPAGLEEGLSANALALAGREAVGVRHRDSVETDVLDGTVLKVGVVVSAILMLEPGKAFMNKAFNARITYRRVKSPTSILKPAGGAMGRGAPLQFCRPAT